MMGHVAAAVTVGLAPGMRRFLIAWFLVMSVLVAVMGLEAIIYGKLIGAAVAGAVVVLLGTVAWRWSSLSVTAGEDGLIVRQFFNTQRINRSELVSFRVGGHRLETPGVAVRAVLRDGSTVVLSATGWYFRSPDDVERCRAALEAWRRTA